MPSHALNPLATVAPSDRAASAKVSGSGEVANGPLSNAALVARYRHCDQGAFAELFRRHRDLVYAVCLGRLRHHHDAEDLTQETFRRLAASIDRWDPRRPLEPWLVRIAGNRCRSFLSRRRSEVTGADWSETSSLAPVAPPAVDQTALAEEIQAAMESLPPHMQTAFVLIHREGWSYDQVSDHLSHPVGTVKTWVHRARLRMIDHLRRSDVGSAESPQARGA